MTLQRQIADYVEGRIVSALAGRVAQGTVVTSPSANTADPLTVQFEGSAVAAPAKLIRNIPVFPGMKVLLFKIHTDWVCVGPYSNPSVGTGATRIAIGADVPQELRDSHDIETVMLFYVVDPETGLEKGYFFKGVSNLFNNERPTLLEGEVLYPTLGDPSSPTSSNVKPNRQSILMGSGVPLDQIFNVHIASIGGFFLQSGARFGVIDGIDGTSTDVFDITKSGGLPFVALSDDVTLTVPDSGTVTVDGAATVNGLLQGMLAIRDSNASGVANSTLVTDGVLSLPGEANAVYELDSWMVVACTSTTPDVKFDLSLPSGGTKRWSAYGLGTGGTTNPGDVDYSQGTGALARGSAVGTLTYHLRGVVRLGGTAGNIAMQYAQNNTDAGNPITVQADSTLRLTKRN